MIYRPQKNVYFLYRPKNVYKFYIKNNMRGGGSVFKKFI